MYLVTVFCPVINMRERKKSIDLRIVSHFHCWGPDRVMFQAWFRMLDHSKSFACSIAMSPDIKPQNGACNWGTSQNRLFTVVNCWRQVGPFIAMVWKSQGIPGTPVAYIPKRNGVLERSLYLIGAFLVKRNVATVDEILKTFYLILQIWLNSFTASDLAVNHANLKQFEKNDGEKVGGFWRETPKLT